jgi:Fe-Mn family superoxide dismutase
VKGLVRLLTFLFIFGGMSLSAAEEGPYQAKDFSHLIGMPGFKDELLKTHFTLYQGYVKNTNLLLDLLARYRRENKLKEYQFGAIKRRLGWEFDGMRLHELYFGNLGGNKELDKKDPLYARITRDFGSYEEWKKDFIATGLIRGVGWSVLYLDPIEGRLMNTWINEHDLGHLAGGIPILVMDVWEHAYMPQFGLDRAAYIDTFFSNIDWEVVASRFKK